jgi:hypothetical protein
MSQIKITNIEDDRVQIKVSRENEGIQRLEVTLHEAGVIASALDEVLADHRAKKHVK